MLALQLKELRAKRVKYEEEMTLAQVRASVGQLLDQSTADEQRQAAVGCVLSFSTLCKAW